jgi:hypothetical protein
MSRSRKKFMKASMYKRGGTSGGIQNGMKEDVMIANKNGSARIYQVLHKNIECRMRGVVIIQHMWHPILKHPVM